MSASSAGAPSPSYYGPPEAESQQPQAQQPPQQQPQQQQQPQLKQGYHESAPTLSTVAGGASGAPSAAAATPVSAPPATDKVETKRTKTRSGVPVVADQMLYSDLLRAAEADLVRSVRYANDRSGRVLVTLKTGQVKSCTVPPEDYSFMELMSRSGIRCRLLTAPAPIISSERADFIYNYASPGVLLLAVWYAVWSFAKKQADSEDRKKIRQKEVREKQEKMRELREEKAEAQSKLAEIEKAEAEGEADEEMQVAKRFLTSIARMTTPSKYRQKGNLTTFDDVAGLGQAKVELEELVTFFTNPEKFAGSGCKVPRGVLLCGPPGTGKTLLARAVAGEAGVTFFASNASEFVEMFVGVGAARVRDLFQQARAQAPSIVFIDELDAVGKQRGSGGGGSGNDERDATVNQLLTELDGFDTNMNKEGKPIDPKKIVVVIAATNRPDILDTALLRAGRFDRKVYVGLPDLNGRREILMVHMKDKPMSEEVLQDVRNENSQLAVRTPEFAGADLKNLVNVASTFAASRSSQEVFMQDFYDAIDLIQMGKPKNEGWGDDYARRLAAFECAKALVALRSELVDEVELISIVPREGLKTGQIRFYQNEIRNAQNLDTRARLKEMIKVAMAGPVAEEMIYGEESKSSLQRAPLDHARHLAQWLVLSGCGSGLDMAGHRSMGRTTEANGVQYFGLHYSLSEERKIVADVEMQILLDRARQDAHRILTEDRQFLDELIDTLVVKGALVNSELHEMHDRYRASHPVAQEPREVSSASRNGHAEQQANGLSNGAQSRPANGNANGSETEDLPATETSTTTATTTTST